MAWDDDEDMDFGFGDMSPEDHERLEREMREKHERIHKHPLFLKAEEIFQTVHTMSETMQQEEREMHMRILLESAMMLAPKILGALSSESWLLSMQNASIVRYHAQYLLTATYSLSEISGVPEEYTQVLQDEMEEFRDMFKEWVRSFKDLADEDIDDEWGLFMRNNQF
jgi:hypothetical protein